jgi:hypothetical protein
MKTTTLRLALFALSTSLFALGAGCSGGSSSTGGAGGSAGEGGAGGSAGQGGAAGNGGAGGAAGNGGAGGSGGASARSFSMGFSPWLYDATLQAQDWTYAAIQSDGDMISHHMEEGVPWPEAYAGTAFSASFVGEINGRLARKVSGQKIVLQINPMDIGRTGLAGYRGNAVNEPLPAPWNGYSFNSPEVKDAFLSYARRMRDDFKPDYLQIGVEVNLLIRNNPGAWSQYVELHQHVYQGLKNDDPALPVGVSFFCVPFFPEYSTPDNLDAQKKGLADIEPSSDFIAFSVHPFMSGLLAETFPDDYLDRLYALTTKPIAVSESSYPAQVWSTKGSPPLTFNGSQEKQAAFTTRLLEDSHEHGALFVIWFAIRDYDALWNGALGQSELALVWRDTGLYDEDGGERMALPVWRSWRDRPHVP